LKVVSRSTYETDLTGMLLGLRSRAICNRDTEYYALEIQL